MKLTDLKLISGQLKALKISPQSSGDTVTNQLAVDGTSLKRKTETSWIEAAFLGEIALYPFSSFNFTTNVTGRSGPSLAQIRSLYSSTAWAQNASFLNVSNGFQIWTVPKSGVYSFTLRGATRSVIDNGGYSSLYTIVVTKRLNVGDKIKILIGQIGTSSAPSGILFACGGGGATAISILGSSTPIAVAGGSGGIGGSNAFNALNGNNQTTGVLRDLKWENQWVTVPTNVTGSDITTAKAFCGSGGSWYLGRTNSESGQALNGTALGGISNRVGGVYRADGGFGGGGGATVLSNGAYSSGGGGGYLGGHPGYSDPAITPYASYGGNGGCFVDTGSVLTYSSSRVELTSPLPGYCLIQRTGD